MKSLIVFLLYCTVPFLFGHFFDLHWVFYLILIMLLSVIGYHTFKLNKITLYFYSFFTTFFVWFLYSWYYDMSNNHLIYNKVSEVFGFKSIYTLMVVQAFFGAILSLLASFVSLMPFSVKGVKKYLKV